MARPLRLEFPGALYHVTSRGNARAPIFLDDSDCRLFLAVLRDVVGRHRWLCHAYCLMPNHYHLLLGTPEANLSRGMRQLNGVYTQRFNRSHDRVGHLLQGRFHAVVVERETHLVELARYIVLNPVRAGLVATAEEYGWSSLRACLGLDPPPGWLSGEAILDAFGSPARYLEFVRAGVNGATPPWTEVHGSILGSTEFIDGLRRPLKARAGAAEVPRPQRRVDQPSLAALFPPAVTEDRLCRNARIREASRERGYLLSEIGRHLGLHYTTVSRIAACPERPFPRGARRARRVGHPVTDALTLKT